MIEMPEERKSREEREVREEREMKGRGGGEGRVFVLCVCCSPPRARDQQLV